MKDLKTRLALEALLRAEPHSYADLAHKLNLDYYSVANYVKKLRDAELAHVGEWGGAKDGRATVAIITWGPGVDAERPTPDSASVRMARTRANKRAAAC